MAVWRMLGLVLRHGAAVINKKKECRIKKKNVHEAVCMPLFKPKHGDLSPATRLAKRRLGGWWLGRAMGEAGGAGGGQGASEAGMLVHGASFYHVDEGLRCSVLPC